MPAAQSEPVPDGLHPAGHAQPEVIAATIRERVAPVIRGDSGIFLEDSPCCEVPQPVVIAAI